MLQVETDKGVFLPVAYKSRKLTDSEQCYPIHDKELAAIMHCIEKWRCYLEGVTFPPCVLTDHRLFQYFNTQSHLTRHQAGWFKHLSPYQLHIKYNPGKELVTSDDLSRLYKASIARDNGLDPDWLILYLCPEATFYKGLNSVTAVLFKLQVGIVGWLTD